MPYVTSVERIAEARGEVRGGANVLLKPLERVCGPLSEDAERRIRELSIQQLEDLSVALLEFRSLDDLLNWLDAHSGPTG